MHRLNFKSPLRYNYGLLDDFKDVKDLEVDNEAESYF